VAGFVEVVVAVVVVVSVLNAAFVVV